MTASTTLRQLSGLPAAPSRLSESALILVDAQNTYRTGVMQLSGVEPALDACASLLARARALKVPVIHIQHDAGPARPTTSGPRSAPLPTRWRPPRASRWW
jgi:nicotinamidase-related amidase